MYVQIHRVHIQNTPKKESPQVILCHVKARIAVPHIISGLGSVLGSSSHVEAQHYGHNDKDSCEN